MKRSFDFENSKKFLGKFKHAVAFICLMTFFQPSAHAENAILNEVHSQFNTSGTEVTNRLLQNLNQSTQNRTQINAVRASLLEGVSLLDETKPKIETVASSLESADFEKFVEVFLKYFELQGKVFSASQTSTELELNQNFIDDHSIRVPNELALTLQRVFAALAADSGEMLFNIHNNPSDSNTKKVQMSGSYFNQLSMMTLAQYPSTGLAEEQIRRSALAMTMFHRAHLDSYLPVDQKVDLTFPDSISSEDKGYLQFLHGDSTRAMKESFVRKNTINDIYTKIIEYIENPNAAQRALYVTLFQEQARQFESHLDRTKNYTVESMVDVYLAGNRSPRLKLTIKQYIQQSMQNYHLLKGRALTNYITSILADLETIFMKEALGCFYYKDNAGAESACLPQNANNTAAKNPEIYVESLGWTDEEKARLTSFLNQEIKKIHEDQMPATVTTGIESILNTIETNMDSKISSFRRHQLSKLLVEGAFLINEYDELTRELFSFAENQDVPVHYFDNHFIYPGLAMLAWGKFGFPLDDQENIPFNIEWHREVLSYFVGSASHPRATDEHRGALAYLLGVSDAQVRDAQGNPRETSVSLLTEKLRSLFEASATIMSDNEVDFARGAGQADQECTGWMLYLDCFSANPELYYRKLERFLGNIFGQSDGGWNGQEVVRAEIKGFLRIILDANTKSRERIGPRSPMARIDSITGIIQQEASASEDKAKALSFMHNFKALNEFATTVNSRVLISSVHRAFNESLQGNFVPLYQLQYEAEQYSELISARRGVIQRFFLPEQERKVVLHRILKFKNVFIEYTQLVIKKLENSLPVLFLKMKLPSYVTRQNGVNKEVPLYKVIVGLDRSINDPSLINLKRSMQSGSSARSFSIPTQHLLSVATSGLQLLPDDVQTFLGQVMLRAKVFYRGTETLDSPHNDRWWPTSVNDYDMSLAKSDSTFMGSCDRYTDERNSTLCRSNRKLLRLLTANFLVPYFHSAVVASQETITRRDELHTLVQTENFNTLSEATHGDAENVLSEVQGSELFWDHYLEGIQGTLQSINGTIFNVFMFTQVSGTKIPKPYEHAFGRMMFIPAMLDLGLNTVFVNHYVGNYLDFLPYAQTAALPQGLYSRSQMSLLSSRANQQLEHLSSRIFLDVAWMYGVSRARHHENGADVTERLPGNPRGRREQSASSSRPRGNLEVAPVTPTERSSTPLRERINNAINQLASRVSIPRIGNSSQATANVRDYARLGLRSREGNIGLIRSTYRSRRNALQSQIFRAEMTRLGSFFRRGTTAGETAYRENTRLIESLNSKLSELRESYARIHRTWNQSNNGTEVALDSDVTTRPEFRRTETLPTREDYELLNIRFGEIDCNAIERFYLNFRENKVRTIREIERISESAEPGTPSQRFRLNMYDRAVEDIANLDAAYTRARSFLESAGQWNLRTPAPRRRAAVEEETVAPETATEATPERANREFLETQREMEEAFNLLEIPYGSTRAQALQRATEVRQMLDQARQDQNHKLIRYRTDLVEAREAYARFERTGGTVEQQEQLLQRIADIQAEVSLIEDAIIPVIETGSVRIMQMRATINDVYSNGQEVSSVRPDPIERIVLRDAFRRMDIRAGTTHSQALENYNRARDSVLHDNGSASTVSSELRKVAELQSLEQDWATIQSYYNRYQSLGINPQLVRAPQWIRPTQQGTAFPPAQVAPEPVAVRPAASTEQTTPAAVEVPTEADFGLFRMNGRSREQNLDLNYVETQYQDILRQIEAQKARDPHDPVANYLSQRAPTVYTKILRWIESQRLQQGGP